MRVEGRQLRIVYDNAKQYLTADNCAVGVETALSSNLPRDLDTLFSTTQQKLFCFRMQRHAR